MSVLDSVAGLLTHGAKHVHSRVSKLWRPHKQASRERRQEAASSTNRIKRLQATPVNLLSTWGGGCLMMSQLAGSQTHTRAYNCICPLTFDPAPENSSAQLSSHLFTPCNLSPPLPVLHLPPSPWKRKQLRT